ncbi:hypothetical protein H6P81_016089 [Aristolochia fimbriata]|uniref:Protein FAR1-RELATED SEQUENCE n=1 Tax=Aristolochia fimbriata TaxID=158543 RepID=A0AAV7E802_ARIFI|nr:hypothetical protein H6P81_016089 [Aristolochia fimbriata]
MAYGSELLESCGIELRPNFDEVIDGKKINLKNKVFKVLEVALRVDEAFAFVSQMIDVILEELSKYTFDSITKAKMPEKINVHPPNVSKTKGSRKRLKRGKEKAMEQANKKLRLCHGCGVRGDHDKRNCPKFKEDIIGASVQYDSQASTIDHFSQELLEKG